MAFLHGQQGVVSQQTTPTAMDKEKLTVGYLLQAVIVCTRLHSSPLVIFETHPQPRIHRPGI